MPNPYAALADQLVFIDERKSQIVDTESVTWEYYEQRSHEIQRDLVALIRQDNLVLQYKHGVQ